MSKTTATTTITTNSDQVPFFQVRRKLYNIIVRGFLRLTTLVTVGLLIFMIGYILINGLKHLTIPMLTTQSSYIEDTIGIFPNIMNTLYMILISMLIALPLGIGAAVYLNEYATNRRLVTTIEFAAETLTGIPSIVFGLVGMLVFIHLFGLKQGVLAGSLTLVMIILPTIIRTTQESLKSIPDDYRHGSLALGSGKWHMVRTVVLPSAMDGIVTGSILAIGRIVGESAALLFTAGFGLRLNSLFKSLQRSSASLTVALYVYVSERGEMEAGFAIAALLMLITLLLNFAATYFGNKLKKR
ncbi:MAG TPA: phosphate ABC transporter permease PstA [Clostridiales bacterium]|mgnify:CR=1 FL=1|jgi:phosphate transport system permease protein|nr:phosphate ABC transporter permease PstA [Clostridiales bacterium]